MSGLGLLARALSLGLTRPRRLRAFNFGLGKQPLKPKMHVHSSLLDWPYRPSAGYSQYDPLEPHEGESEEISPGPTRSTSGSFKGNYGDFSKICFILGSL